jgi:hypothetical protein
MISTKQKCKNPLLTRRAALTTLPGVFIANRDFVVGARFRRQFREGW